MTSRHAGKSLEVVLEAMNSAHENATYSATLEGFATLLREAHQRSFSEGKAANGTPWAPLRPSTIRKKGHGIILVETDRLMDSLTKNTGDSRWTHDEREAEFGTAVPYAGFHQKGTNKFPARPPVGIDKKTLDAMVERVADREAALIVQR